MGGNAICEVAQTGSPAFRAPSRTISICRGMTAVLSSRSAIADSGLIVINSAQTCRAARTAEMTEGRGEVSTRYVGVGHQKDALVELRNSRLIAAGEEISSAELSQIQDGSAQR